MDANCPPEPPALQVIKSVRKKTDAMSAAWRCNGISRNAIYDPVANILTLHDHIDARSGFTTSLVRYADIARAHAIKLTDVFIRQGHRPAGAAIHSYDCYRNDGDGKYGMKIVPAPHLANHVGAPETGGPEPFYTVTLSTPTDEGRAIPLRGRSQVIETVDKNKHLCPD